MKAKWMDKEAKVWFIEQNGSIKMDSTGSAHCATTQAICQLEKMLLRYGHGPLPRLHN
jgi:hypothetical protein